MNKVVRNVVIILILVIMMIIFFRNKKEDKHEDLIIEKEEYYIEYDENKINNEIIKIFKMNKVILTVGKDEIKKIDIDLYKEKGFDYAVSKNIKRSVVSQEVKKMGIVIKDEDVNKYKIEGSKSYTNENVDINKEEYINIYVERRIKSDEWFAFQLEITDRINNNLLQCDDEIINEKIEKYHNYAAEQNFSEGIKELAEIIDLYIIFISRDYVISYNN